MAASAANPTYEPAPASPLANDPSEDDVAGNIADIVSESLAETGDGPDDAFRPPVEPLDIDVVSDPHRPGPDPFEEAEETFTITTGF